MLNRTPGSANHLVVLSPLDEMPAMPVTTCGRPLEQLWCLRFMVQLKKLLCKRQSKRQKAARKERLMAHIVNLESRRKEKQEKLVQALANGMERRQGQERGVERREQFQVRFS